MKKGDPVRAAIRWLVLGGLLMVACVYGRFQGISPKPAVVVSAAHDKDACWIEVQLSPAPSKFFRFYREPQLQSVINMANVDQELIHLQDRPLACGTHLVLHQGDGQRIEIEQKCIRASRRISLGIPLEMQCMSAEDWIALPGVGPRLTERIELYRQKNGEFQSLDALQKVRGIGPTRIRQWRHFFSIPESVEK